MTQVLLRSRKEDQTISYTLIYTETKRGVQGTIGQAENAFHVQINTYRAPSGQQFYAPTTDPSVPTPLASIIQSVNDTIPVVSTSWGACEPIVTQATAQQENTLFTVAAAQGQSIFASAADHGTDDYDNATTETVDDPASQPYVIGVGETSLTQPTRSLWDTRYPWIFKPLVGRR